MLRVRQSADSGALLRGEEDAPMPFNERSRLDTSQVEDRRGRGRGPQWPSGAGDSA